MRAMEWGLAMPEPTILGLLASIVSTLHLFSATPLVSISPTVALTSVQIIAANPNRKGFVLYNNGGNSAYITYGTTSSSAAPSFIIGAFTNGPTVITTPVIYTGPLAAVRNAGSGTIIITEFL
jgi:hypothetical protein